VKALRKRFGAELGMVVITLALVAGALVGSGFAASNLDTVDPLAWLANREGGITRVNPQTGRPVDGLKIAQSGANLQVTQADGILTVMDPDSKQLIVIDLSMLSVAGRRSANGDFEVLVSTGKIYLVNKGVGDLERIHPLNASTIGRPVRLEKRLADTTVAADGAVWLLDQKGELQSQEWSDSQTGFVQGERRTIAGAGERAVLVAHGSGVTVVDPATRTATQTGTGEGDRTTTLPPLDGQLLAADISPADLAVVSAPAKSALLLVRGDEASIVDAGKRGCRKPGKPVVFNGRIYAACPGDRKVIVVDPAGGPAQDIPAPPGEDLELVAHAGMLLVNVRDGQDGLVIMPNGEVREIRTHDARLPVTVPTPIASAVPSTMDNRGNGRNSPTAGVTTGAPRTGAPAPNATTGPPRTGTPGPGPGQTRTPGPGATTAAPTTAAPGPQQQTPTGVNAVARPDGTIRVSWTAPQIAPASYRVVHVESTQVVASTNGMATSAIATVRPVGQPASFFVEAVAANGRVYRSAQSAPATPFGRPDAPGIQPVGVAARGPLSIVLRVTVDPGSDGGSPLSTYDVTVTDSGGRSLAAAQGIPIGQRPYDFTVTCDQNSDLCLAGGDVNVTATVSNAAGAGPGASRGSNVPYPAAFNYGDTVMIISSGMKCLDRTGRDMYLRTCNGSQSQLWRPLATADIHSAVDNQCMFTDDDGKLTLHDSRTNDCTQKEHRYNHVRIDRNDRYLQNDDHRGCILPIGDPAGEGVPVRTNADCQFTIAERWTLFKPVQPLTSVAAVSPAAAMPTGMPAAAMPGVMLLVLAASLVQIRYRSRRWR